MKKWSIYSFVIFAVGAAVVGCQQTQDAFSERKTRDNTAEIHQYATAHHIKIDSTVLGLYYNVKSPDTSAQKPQIGDEITMSYIARRLDGTIVDSSSVAYPYKFIRVPSSSSSTYRFSPVPAIEGLMTDGVTKLHQGDTLTLFVPWFLRSSNSASLLAPLYVPLRYDIVVLNVRTEDEQIEDYIKYRGLNVTEKATNGLRFGTLQTFKDSTQIKFGDVVLVSYLGRLVANNYQFDPVLTPTSTVSTLNVTVADTATSNAGGSVVKGFNDGVYRLKFGEKAFIIFPSSLGYGASPKGSIPAYSPLYFEIQSGRPL